MTRCLFAPDYPIFAKIVFHLLNSNPMVMIPVKLPTLLYQIKENILPDYLQYALLASGVSFLSKEDDFPNRLKDKNYANISLGLLKKHNDITNPFFLWTSAMLALFYWNIMKEKGFYETLGTLYFNITFTQID
ncbi:hypothetical protein AYI69_g6161 [Smittium culicis]|uniref:Uncharacterized protein n=1 Tax=Smittium culicis TaxID=133412 RepID=A0A1R1Y0U8_9FUNG|nr:hypothetical protein AYI69_g6161 [Smittium culicis]